MAAQLTTEALSEESEVPGGRPSGVMWDLGSVPPTWGQECLNFRRLVVARKQEAPEESNLAPTL